MCCFLYVFEVLTLELGLGTRDSQEPHITGDSLGGALTHIATFSLNDAGFGIAKFYSFEAPRVGNTAVAKGEPEWEGEGVGRAGCPG